MLPGRFHVPRARFWLPLAAVVVLALCVRFDLHYHVIGLFRGDAYFQGLPTSYWRDAATYRIHGPPKWLEPLHRWMPRPQQDERLPVYKGGVEALPVLRQLAEDPDTDLQVRLSVLRLFRRDRAFAIWDKPSAVPEVFDVARCCFEDPNSDLQEASAWLLLHADDAEQAFRFLQEQYLVRLRDPTPTGRMIGINGLAQLTQHCEGSRRNDLLNHIKAMTKDSDGGIRGHAQMIWELFSKAAASNGK